MFVKLKNEFTKPLFTTIDGMESFAGVDGKGVSHKRIWTPDSDMFYSVIPKRYWVDFDLTLLTINSHIYPHIDRDLITTINFYINTDGGSGRTVYYTPRLNSKSISKVDGREIDYVENIYNKDDVIEVASFTALDNEAWLIDVSKIHNVEVNENFKIRKALALRTQKYTYEQVYDMLIETGNL